MFVFVEIEDSMSVPATNMFVFVEIMDSMSVSATNMFVFVEIMDSMSVSATNMFVFVEIAYSMSARIDLRAGLPKIRQKSPPYFGVTFSNHSESGFVS
ncbi:MAG TPA: hypothetical protein VFH42_01355 [Sporolactobacillaceae bacterium]|nr:hypothetical protein [Sporolactobacillaceae bacterium]